MDGRAQLRKQGPLSLEQKAKKWFDTIKDWSWNAAAPSPQTGKMYPSAGRFHNGESTVTLGEMFDAAGKVKPEWIEDFKNTVIAWCNDLVNKLHPALNRMKDMVGLKDDIKAQNKEQYRAALTEINNTLLGAPVAPGAAAAPTVAAAPGVPATGQFPTYKSFVST